MKKEVYLKDLIDYLPRSRFLNIVRKICRDNNIKFPIAKAQSPHTKTKRNDRAND